MSDAATAPRKARVRQSKANAEHQKEWRKRQKRRFLEALALLEAIPDDAPILIIGKDAEC